MAIKEQQSSSSGKIIVRNAVEDFLTSDEWHYRYNEENETIVAGVNIKSKLKETELRIRIGDHRYIVYAYINIAADEDCRERVAEYIARANYGLTWGNFELDMRDGEIRYKYPVDFGDDCDTIPSDSIIARSIYIPCEMMQKYGDGLIAVMYDIKTPEEAIKEAEAD